MSLQEAAPQTGRRTTKFSPTNVQKIRDSVAQGLSRIEISELLDVTLGSLQVTCSKLGISLRKRYVLNGNGRHHDISNHPPKVGRKRAGWQFQMDRKGARRTIDLLFTDSGIAQLATAAEMRNLSMGQVLTDAVVTAIKKNMVERILCETAPKPEDA